MSDEEVDRIAEMIIRNPKLREKYFANPGKLLAQSVPRKGVSGRLSPKVQAETTARRAKLASKVEEKITQDQRLSSVREAFNEREAFFKAAMRNPQLAFITILVMSVVIFFIGIGLVVGAFLAAFLLDETTQRAVIGGLSGGAGIVTTLGTVFMMSRNAVRRINGDNAQIRVILSDFATETAQLRAIPINNFDEAKERNGELRKLMIDVVWQIETYVEPSSRSQRNS